MFITQHSSVTVDGKLSPTVNALLSRGQDFLRFTGSAHGVTFHFELQNNAPVIVMTATSVNPHYFIYFVIQWLQNDVSTAKMNVGHAENIGERRRTRTSP